MALLSVTDRTRIWRALQRRWSNDRDSCNATKYQLYNPATDTGAIADVDAWRDSRTGLTAPDTVGFNGAFNASYRALFTPNQKTDIFIAVVAMSRGVEYLRSVFGDPE